jgi:DNA (cytosine-5)-methyltransferase 1
MTTYTFIDLFSGCGGLSLGLTSAGLEGQFAIERDPMAFETFSDNFLGDRKVPLAKFKWPSWLKRQAWAIDELLAAHQADLQGLTGKIDVLAGGPPCQGFSFAGRRQESDPRNQLFEKYVHVVETIKPRALVLENVPGMMVAHSSKDESGEKRVQASESFYDKLKLRLESVGYAVRGMILDASRFGVPQKRSRLIVLGIRKELADRLPGGVDRAFALLEVKRAAQLRDLGLDEKICAGEAISDLRSDRGQRKPCTDEKSPRGYEEAVYRGADTTYQRLMHSGCADHEMDSMRLARHGQPVRDRFAAILAECARGGNMNQASREKYGLKKQRIHPMSPSEPAPTITTLPDDVLHYAEPRILTVRESARLQSFPDWFRFRGKFTTGGAMRTKECPRYTQVGNAVPPLLGRAIGLALAAALSEAARPVVLASKNETRKKQQDLTIAL